MLVAVRRLVVRSACVAGVIAGCSSPPASAPPNDPDPVTPACAAAAAGAPASFAAQMAEVTGRITMNGGPWLSAPRVTFTQSGAGEDETLPGRPLWNADGTGDGRFSVRVPHGAYDVTLFGAGSTFFRDVLATGVAVRGPIALSFNLETVSVTGIVRLAGGPFPDEAGGRGTVCLREVGKASNSFCAALPDTGTPTFALEVRRGRAYDVSWSRAGTVASTAPVGRIPYGEHSFGERVIDGDTALDLDIDGATLVLAGRVSVDGGPLPAPATGGGASVSMGSIVVEIADPNAPNFRIRLLAGRYLPLVLVADQTVPSGFWVPCAPAGCALTGDTEWSLDVSTARAPQGVVEGTVDFIVPPGSAPALAPARAVGEVTLQLEAAGASPQTVIPFHGGGTSLSTHVSGGDYGFRIGAVPDGTYSVWFSGFDLPGTPIGRFRFEETLVVAGAQVTWRGTAPLVPVVIDVQVGGQAMASDTRLEGEPRGELRFSVGPKDQLPFTMSIGERGPARFERLMLPGRYQVAIESTTYQGRTYVRGYEQDVLPAGRLELGAVDVPAASGPEPVRLPFDLQIRDVPFRVDSSALVAPGATSRHDFVRLVSEDGHPFWGVEPATAAGGTMRLYSGCYSVRTLSSSVAFFPDARTRLDGEAEVGTLCTCDRTAAVQDLSR